MTLLSLFFARVAHASGAIANYYRARTQHGVPADRFAREILAFLMRSYAARSRQLNANPLGLMQSNADFQAFQESLLAAARGPFFPDWEFQTLIGLDRPAVESIAASFTASTPLVGDVALALHNSMGNLIGYPHGQEAAWGIANP